MKIDLLDRAQLELLNRRGLRYHLQDAEKDYFLAIIISVLYNSKFRETLVFKGGSAVYHCYLDQLRFSKDLDFTSRDKLEIEDIEELFMDFGIFKVKDMREKRFGLDFLLQYRGPLGQPDSIGIDINTNQKVVIEPKLKGYRNYYGVKFSCLVMDIMEIFAEKIRTLNERARPRDLYDIAILKKNFDIKIKDGIAILRQKELYIPLDTKRIEENIDICLDRWDQEMKELYYKQPLDIDEIKKLSDGVLMEIDS